MLVSACKCIWQRASILSVHCLGLEYGYRYAPSFQKAMSKLPLASCQPSFTFSGLGDLDEYQKSLPSQSLVLSHSSPPFSDFLCFKHILISDLLSYLFLTCVVHIATKGCPVQTKHTQPQQHSLSPPLPTCSPPSLSFSCCFSPPLSISPLHLFFFHSKTQNNHFTFMYFVHSSFPLVCTYSQGSAVSPWLALALFSSPLRVEQKSFS